MGRLPFEYLLRKELVRKDSRTDPNFGCKPKDRSVEELISYGIVNIDKPPGPTSHQVSAYLQDILGIDKGGHSGTLDPNVTGVLPTALCKGTRIVQTLLTAGKEYIALMHLHKEVKEKKVKQIMKSFVGKIIQKPPVKSAVKRVEREREIYYMEFMEMDGQDVLFRVGCEAGTYIRKLIYDMGNKLKVGAHMAELRRTKAGPFDESTLFTLQDLADAYHYYKSEGNEKYIRKVVQPMENGVEHLAKVWVVDSSVSSLTHGSDLKVPGIAKVHDQIEKGDRVGVFSLKNELICLGVAKMKTKDMLKDKGVAIKTEKVFMADDRYEIKT
jgi:H/ACA ribonucleoprotein complex subunit 4